MAFSCLSHFLSARVLYAILFYTLLITLLVVSKPRFMFDEDGQLKPFGTGSEQTVYSLGVFVVIVPFFCFYLFSLFEKSSAQ